MRSPVNGRRQAPKLSVKPTGRILMDGAVYMGGNGDIKNDEEDTKFVDGVAIPDLRLGVKASLWQMEKQK